MYLRTSVITDEFLKEKDGENRIDVLPVLLVSIKCPKNTSHFFVTIQYRSHRKTVYQSDPKDN